MDSPKKILLIDDDPSLLVTLGDFLKFEGYEVVTAESGEKGLKHLERLCPDLIILDMSMPGMGGLGFLKEISDASGKPQHPVLVLTARANMADFFSDVDVDGFISKPCNPDDLLSEVSRITFLRSSESARSHAEEGRSTRKILIGEDDGGVGGRLAEFFKKEGFQVTRVGKGPETIEKAVVVRPDVILMKRIFEGMNGNTVAGMLQQMPNTRNIPVVLYDESDELYAESDFVKAGSGVRRYLRTSEPSRLLSAVETILTD